MALRRLLILLLIGLVAGCGFHLRGSTPLPPGMAVTYLQGAEGSALRFELESTLIASGVALAPQRGDGIALLTLQREKLSSRVIALDSQGRASGRTLTLQLRFSMVDGDGRQLAMNEPLRVERDFTFDPDEVLAGGEWESRLRREMYRQAAQQIVRRLRALGRAPQS